MSPTQVLQPRSAALAPSAQLLHSVTSFDQAPSASATAAGLPFHNDMDLSSKLSPL